MQLGHGEITVFRKGDSILATVDEGVEYTRLLQVMRQSILGDQMMLHQNYRADPFARKMRRFQAVVAIAARSFILAAATARDFIEMRQVVPRSSANRPCQIKP